MYMDSRNLLEKKTPSDTPELTQHNEEHRQDKAPHKTHPWRRVIIVLILAVFCFAGIIGYKAYSVGSTILVQDEGTTLFDQIKTLISAPDKSLKGEDDGRVNILLLGFGGKGHQGAYLTDTMIVASLKPATKEVAMISVPRDLFVDIPGYGYRKINNAFAFGETEGVDGGGESLAQATVQSVLGIPIHYYAWVDFTGFEKILDDVDGITVNVDQSFVDYSYPTLDYGYQTVKFTEGNQTMDGETALKYVRSRHGTNGEGSDFARSKRQQKVILAVKEKFSGLGTLTNPSKINAVLNDLATHMKTNLQLWEISKIAKLYNDVSQEQIVTKVLDNGSDGLLVSDHTQDGAYILRPKAGWEDFSDIQYTAQNIFEVTALAREEATIAVFNGTGQEGLATSTANDLESLDYTIKKVGNTSAQVSTTIYDLSGGTKPKSVAALQEKIGGTVQTTPPASIEALIATEPPVDIVIVLGSDFLNERAQGGPVT